MKKITPQPALQITGFDFNVLYNSNGSANINYRLFSENGRNLEGQIKVEKEFTDNWVESDQPIIDLISQETGLNLSPIE